MDTIEYAIYRMATARGTGGNDADTPLTITAQGGDHG